jgi:hypothetical protein
VTPLWVTVVIALLSGLAGSVVSVWLTSRHERVTDLRGRVLAAATDFSGHVQQALGPVRTAVDARFAEPEELDDDGDENVVDDAADEEDADEADPADYWSRKTLDAYAEAERAVLLADERLTPLLLLLPENCQAMRSAVAAISMLSVAIGSLREIPRDHRSFTDNYVLRAGLEWRAFNVACQRELRRVGRWVPPWTRRSERARHESWLQKEEHARTFTDYEGLRRVRA